MSRNQREETYKTNTEKTLEKTTNYLTPILLSVETPSVCGARSALFLQLVSVGQRAGGHLECLHRCRGNGPKTAAEQKSEPIFQSCFPDSCINLLPHHVFFSRRNRTRVEYKHKYKAFRYSTRLTVRLGKRALDMRADS